MTYGIPNFKLPKQVVFCRWNDLEKAGVEFAPETYIGKEKTIDDLFSDGYQAVFVGVGVSMTMFGPSRRILFDWLALPL